MPINGRKDTWSCTFTIDGRNCGVWDVQTGGEVDSSELTYKPGGMAPTLSLGGSVTIGQVVASRIYQYQRDHAIIKWLIARVGKAVVVMNKQPLDYDGNAWGARLTLRGILKRCTPPEIDSTSTDAATVEIEFTPEGTYT